MQFLQEFLDKHDLCPFERKLTKYELTKMNEILEGKEYNGLNNWVSYFYGLYNYYEKDDNIKAEKYYLISIYHGNTSAMNNLGDLYKYQKKYDEAEKYYFMSGDSYAMNGLGVLYDKQKKCDLAEKYYLMAISRMANDGNTSAIINLGVLYNGQKKYDKAVKYYLMYNNTIDFLRQIPDKELYPQLIKYPESKDAKQIISDLIKDRDILLIHNKLQTCVRKGECSICYMADGTDLILSSCYFHSFCVECSLKIDKCALCGVC